MNPEPDPPPRGEPPDPTPIEAGTERAATKGSGAGRSPEDLRNEIITLIGHTQDPPSLIDLLVRAHLSFDRGDNRRAASLLRQLLRQEPSRPLESLTRTLLGRIHLDRRAGALGIFLLVVLALLWWLSVGANR